MFVISFPKIPRTWSKAPQFGRSQHDKQTNYILLNSYIFRVKAKTISAQLQSSFSLAKGARAN
jgi:hypothetical protein